ncbi:DUF6069 family protein [Actinoplanes sp. NPDC049265]|uniref:DUF6069 family protein n=1 Tax=Actinoplanes sp. NPDC049265 TaxID=3363902 RepID=UPI0037103B93
MALRNGVRDVSAGARRRNRVIAVVGAVVAAVLIWVVGEPLLGYDLILEPPGQQAIDLGASAIVTVALLVGLLGWAFLAVLERVLAKGRLVWTVVALVVLAASFLPLFSVDAPSGSKVTLALVHLAVAGVLIPVFWATSKQVRQ